MNPTPHELAATSDSLEAQRGRESPQRVAPWAVSLFGGMQVLLHCFQHRDGYMCSARWEAVQLPLAVAQHQQLKTKMPSCIRVMVIP
ncbi:hypothetical protein V7S43_001998 [Phytophthora oleae]|uniref:Uncharacterized protein n=1 Tax=Phytophthora oleae TaxID=2107226 RepID=A0ABD3G2K3_9STRA